MKYKHFIVASSVLAGASLFGPIANADTNTTKLENSAFTYGANLDESQKEQTKNVLDADKADKTYTVTSQDMAKYVNQHYDTVYSSTYIEPKSFGQHGVSVEIETPDNITNVSQSDFENAAITAGIQDANIRVGAVVETLGYGALSGIYKAMDEQGVELNQNDMKAAQDETKALSDIKDNKDIDDKALNGSVADMKGQVADKSQEGKVSDDDVSQIVDDSLKENGLSDYITENEKNQLNDIVKNARDSESLKKDPNAYKKQADKLKSNLSEAMDKAKEKANNLNDEKDEGFWQSVKDFFSGLF